MLAALSVKVYVSQSLQTTWFNTECSGQTCLLQVVHIVATFLSTLRGHTTHRSFLAAGGVDGIGLIFLLGEHVTPHSDNAACRPLGLAALVSC